MSRKKNLYPELNEGLRKKDWDTFGKIYQLFHKDLASFILKKYRLQPADAADITQGAFEALWEVYKEDRVFETVSDIRAYLWTIAIHLVSDRHKKKGDKYIWKELSEENYAENDYEVAIDVDNIMRKQWQQDKAVNDTILSMKPGQLREILIMWFIHDRSMKEIASLLNTSVNNVRNQMSKGIKILIPVLKIRHLLQYLIYVLVSGLLIANNTQIVIVP